MLILASRSPRRSELLRAAGIDFIVRTADIDETPGPGEQASDYVLRLAESKARAIDRAAGEIILAADTTVVLDGEILGKPADKADAIRMLTTLSGKRHEVMTGICVGRDGKFTTDLSVTAVWFSPMTSGEIQSYVDSGEPMDKAGAYAIQGLASRYIPRIEGSYANVVGLPIDRVHRLLNSLLNTTAVPALG